MTAAGDRSFRSLVPLSKFRHFLHPRENVKCTTFLNVLHQSIFVIQKSHKRENSYFSLRSFAMTCTLFFYWKIPRLLREPPSPHSMIKKQEKKSTSGNFLSSNRPILFSVPEAFFLYHWMGEKGVHPWDALSLVVWTCTNSEKACTFIANYRRVEKLGYCLMRKWAFRSSFTGETSSGWMHKCEDVLFSRTHGWSRGSRGCFGKKIVRRK